MDINEGKRRHSTKPSRTPSPEPSRVSSAGSGESFRPIARTPPPARAGPPPSPPVPTCPVAPVAPEPAGPLALIPCAVCNRTFVPESLAKHVKICEKMAAKRRKTFDSSRQRREGTDLEQYLPKNFGLPENSPFLEKSPPTTDKVTPKPKPQTVRTNIMKPAADLQKCPHCGRAFGVRAFERHVEWCADKAKILPAAPAQPPPHIADAKQRLNARTQYKAPLARGRRSSQTRDKSSNSRSASVESTRGASPPPPREYGDCRNRRARASESVSSNDCHEEPSPHVPVIRNMRTSQNSSSGDANVKARQARLARDLSTSRNSNEPNHASVQHSSTDPNLKKAQNKPVNKLSVKKQQQIKKLEEIANKYNERQAKATEEIEKKIQEKKQIPVLRRFSNKKNIPNQTVDNSCKSETAQETLIPKPSSSKIKTILPKNTTEKTQKVNQKNNLTNVKDNNTIRKREKKNKIELMKENSMSIDSLDDVAISVSEKTCQSIGINTELLCVPCVIHENFDIKHPNSSGKKKNKLSFVDNLQFSERSGKDDVSDEKLELLYKNPTMVSSCDIQAKMSSISNFIKSNDFTPDSYKDNLKSDVNPVTETTDSSSTQLEPLNSDEVLGCDDNLEVVHDLSAEHFEDSYEHNVSVDNFDNSEGNKSENENDIKNNEIECRHGSGETYTKFTESPGDLEEFLNLTDKMINIQDYSQSDTALKNHIENLHTPRTNSLETINDKNVEEVDNIESKQHFSDTLEDLKSDLKELLTEAGDTIGKEVKQVDNNDELKMEVSDMEHITVYGLKFYEQKQCKEEICETDNESSKLKLPSISETNKPETKTCNKNRMKKIFKINRKYKMLGEQNRGDVDNKTFIVKKEIDESDDQSITLEAPPLKLPRIEKKRTEDTYDPFVSAARQMKELLSSESNLPKKIHNSSKDLSRTLPILRPAKDKAPASQLRPENSKLMKDTLNKTYQKTPTLQRMKSFGSTNNDNNTSTLGGRCSSFRINRNDKKMAPKLNTTFTKSSKENISIVDKTNFNRNNSLNRSFSSYTASSYNTPKLKDKIPKISTSMYHSFQRTTIKQPVKLDKINKDDEKKNFVNLDSILVDDNSSMTDSNYIDPRLINENDNLPINVNTILNNPDIISSMESLLTTENLPAKFDSFSKTQNYELNGNIELQIKTQKDKINNNSDTNKLITAPIDNLSTHYDKIMSSLEDGIASKTLTRDGESVFDDFDLEEFMTTFDEEIHKKKSDSKRICSSTTRVVRQSELAGSNRTSAFSSVSSTPKSVNPSSNGFSPITNSNSFNFSSKNVANESFLPSSIKRSTSLLDSIQKKNTTKTEGGKTRHKSDQMEIDRDLMQSLKDFDKFYESERNEICQSNKDVINYNMKVQNGTSKKDSRVKTQRRSGKSENNTNGNYTPNGKSSNDSAYSSLNRISPSKLSVCAQEPHGPPSLRQAPGSDSSGPRDEARSVSSEEFLAMERSAELEPARRTPHDDEVADKHVSSRASSRRGSWRPRAGLSSSSSEASLHAPHAPHGLPAPRPSRFCHECGSKFPVDTAKFCMECGVKRLLL